MVTVAKDLRQQTKQGETLLMTCRRDRSVRVHCAVLRASGPYRRSQGARGGLDTDSDSELASEVDALNRQMDVGQKHIETLVSVLTMVTVGFFKVHEIALSWGVGPQHPSHPTLRQRQGPERLEQVIGNDTLERISECNGDRTFGGFDDPISRVMKKVVEVVRLFPQESNAPRRRLWCQ